MGSAKPVRSEEPVPIRCAGCRKTIAWTDGISALRNRLYCSHWCMQEPEVYPTEERVDQWRMLYRSGMSPVAIANLYGVAHSQVYVAIGRMGPKTAQNRTRKTPKKTPKTASRSRKP